MIGHTKRTGSLVPEGIEAGAMTLMKRPIFEPSINASHAFSGFCLTVLRLHAGSGRQDQPLNRRGVDVLLVASCAVCSGVLRASEARRGSRRGKAQVTDTIHLIRNVEY